MLASLKALEGRRDLTDSAVREKGIAHLAWLGDRLFDGEYRRGDLRVTSSVTGMEPSRTVELWLPSLRITSQNMERRQQVAQPLHFDIRFLYVAGHNGLPHINATRETFSEGEDALWPPAATEFDSCLSSKDGFGILALSGALIRANMIQVQSAFEIE